MRKIFNLVIFFAIGALPLFAQQKLHVVIFADTNDGKIGTGVKEDIKIWEGLVTNIGTALKAKGVTVSTYKYVGSNCQPEKFNSFLSTFSCKGDIVLFYYNGHGGRSHKDSSKFPRMCMASHYADKWVKVSDVVSQIKAKEPRLQILVTDCCNSYYDRVAKDESYQVNVKSNGQIFQNLFLNYTGDVCITAASPGEYGWCTNRGSYLTMNFNEIFSDVDRRGNATTWEAVFKSTSDKTYKDTKAQYDRRCISNSQHPVYEVNVTRVGRDSSINRNNDTTTTSRVNNSNTPCINSRGTSTRRVDNGGTGAGSSTTVRSTLIKPNRIRIIDRGSRNSRTTMDTTVLYNSYLEKE